MFKLKVKTKPLQQWSDMDTVLAAFYLIRSSFLLQQMHDENKQKKLFKTYRHENIYKTKIY